METFGTAVLVLLGFVLGGVGVVSGWLSFWLLGLDAGLVLVALGVASSGWSLYGGYEFVNAG